MGPSRFWMTGGKVPEPNEDTKKLFDAFSYLPHSFSIGKWIAEEDAELKTLILKAVQVWHSISQNLLWLTSVCRMRGQGSRQEAIATFARKAEFVICDVQEAANLTFMNCKLQSKEPVTEKDVKANEEQLASIKLEDPGNSPLEYSCHNFEADI